MTVSLSLDNPGPDSKLLDTISHAVVKSRKIVIVTGAGISCSCGIPDFRSSDGLYNLVKSRYPNVLVKGRDLFDASLFRDPTSTAIFYTFIAGLKTSIDAAEPSPTHRFIKTLDTKGKLLRSYTQNIDGLEERVGLLSSSSEEARAKPKGKSASAPTASSSAASSTSSFSSTLSSSQPSIKPGKLNVKDVKSVLLHGDIHRVRCTMCSASYKCEEAHIQAFSTGQPPDCPECLDRSAIRVARSARPLAVGTLRPAIVLYDEPHPLGDEIGAIEGRDLARKPDLLIIMGTSLKVHGLKKLVREFANVIHNPPQASSSTSVNSATSGSTPPPPLTGTQTTLPVQATKPSRAKSSSQMVIFVNKTAPGSEWSNIIDYHVEGETDAWVANVLQYWKTHRRSDWEVQTSLDIPSLAGFIEGVPMAAVSKTSTKMLKGVGAPNKSKKTSAAKKFNGSRTVENDENVPSSQTTVVEGKPNYKKPSKEKKPLKIPTYQEPGATKPKKSSMRAKSTSAPQLFLQCVEMPKALSPSKRFNRTYSRQQSLETQDETDVQCSQTTEVEWPSDSDSEPPTYEPESLKGSPTKRHRRHGRPDDMSIDRDSPPRVYLPTGERTMLFTQNPPLAPQPTLQDTKGKRIIKERVPSFKKVAMNTARPPRDEFDMSLDDIDVFA